MHGVACIYNLTWERRGEEVGGEERIGRITKYIRRNQSESKGASARQPWYNLYLNMEHGYNLYIVSK